MLGSRGSAKLPEKTLTPGQKVTVERDVEQDRHGRGEVET